MENKEEELLKKTPEEAVEDLTAKIEIVTKALHNSRNSSSRNDFLITFKKILGLSPDTPLSDKLLPSHLLPELRKSYEKEKAKLEKLIGPPLDLKKLIPVTEEELEEQNRKTELLAKLRAVQAALGNLSLDRIRNEALEIAEQIFRVKNVISDRVEHPNYVPTAAPESILGSPDLGSACYDISEPFHREEPPPSERSEETKRFTRLDCAANYAVNQLTRSGPLKAGTAELALNAVKSFSHELTATIALIEREADGSVRMKGIAEIRKELVPEVIEEIKRIGQEKLGEFGIPLPTVVTQPVAEPPQQKLDWSGSRKSRHIERCKYIIDCLEDYRKKLRDNYRDELERGVTTHLSLPTVDYVVKWVRLRRDPEITRRIIDVVLFNALGTSVNSYALFRNIGRQEAQILQQAKDSKMNARRELKPSDYKVTNHIDRIDPNIIMYWNQLPSNCAFVLKDHKPTYTEKFNKKTYVENLRVCLQ